VSFKSGGNGAKLAKQQSEYEYDEESYDDEEEEEEDTRPQGADKENIAQPKVPQYVQRTSEVGKAAKVERQSVKRNNAVY
jgi:hypothetical protein